MKSKKIVAEMTLAAIAATAAFTAIGTASLAQAHAKIASAEPAPDSALPVAPKAIRLHFNEALEPAFSKIALFDAHQLAIALPTVVVDKDDPKTMSATVPALTLGTYTVRWTAMTHDGHKVKGQYSFTVK